MQADKLMDLPQSSHGYQYRTVGRADALRVQLATLAQQYPRHGSPPLNVLAQREVQLCCEVRQ